MLLSPSVPEFWDQSASRPPCRSRKVLRAAKTSMLQDAEHARPVEIDVLLTVTRDLGRMVGVPTPFIDSVLGLARLKATSLGLLDRAA